VARPELTFQGEAPHPTQDAAFRLCDRNWGGVQGRPGTLRSGGTDARPERPGFADELRRREVVSQFDLT
jgi:hypothetical protein